MINKFSMFVIEPKDLGINWQIFYFIEKSDNRLAVLGHEEYLTFLINVPLVMIKVFDLFIKSTLCTLPVAGGVDRGLRAFFAHASMRVFHTRVSVYFAQVGESTCSWMFEYPLLCILLYSFHSKY